MKKITTLFKQSALVIAAFIGIATTSSAQAFTEDFNDITTLTGSGWSMQNLSTPVGSTNWFQGTSVAAAGPFDSFNGAANAYIGANYNNTGSTGTISNWMMTPNRTFRNGDVFTFYSRKVSPDTYADRLEVRLSTNGASTNAGANATTVGDFTTLLLSINPTLVLGVYPVVWTQYTITISGLPAPTSGRIGFRYFVTSAGSSGTNSDYVGIDAVVYTPYVCPVFTVTGTTPNGTAGTAYSQTLSQTGSLGTPTYSLTAGALPPGLSLSAAGTISGTPTATGTFNFTVTVNDASGCSGAQSFSITIVCPTGGASLSSLPAQCDNGTMYTLVEGSPAGGTYSGTGVSGGMFDPAAGTQTITYTLIDVYGCTQTTSGSITVNAAPSVSLSSFTAVCDNGGMVTLSGESPTGGTWSGTNVSGNMFDPSSGSQSIMYMYTDANGCSDMASQTFTVNAAPAVTLSSFNAVCDNGGMVTLTGESPAGGTWSGTNVSGNMFDPSAGSQSIMYMYTDANGCSNMATQTLTVNAAPTVTLSSFTTVCDNGGMVTLTGESPAGGTWSGTNVSGNMFDPSAGTQAVSYMYTDANGCSATATQQFTVNAAPTITITSINAICSNSSMLTLTGATPAGGTWSGTGVSAGQFDPASGTQTVTYTFTGANGCTNSNSTMVTVNTAPTATYTSTINTVCLNDAAVTLSGGSPAGGVYSGTGVSAGNFNPMTAGNGTHVITYTYTDANSCSDAATHSIVVNACVGINEIVSDNQLMIFPNPTTGVFTIALAQEVQGAVTVNIMSVDGKLISSEQRTATNSTLNFDLSAQPKGVYLLEVQSAAGRSYTKIILE
ncbi:hypothetical protein BH11BAC7_BH11BAC7_25910 [soil metagenome]